jgi:peroxiredoxin
VAYTQIATISTDDHHTLQEFRASVGAQWTFLSDADRTVQTVAKSRLPKDLETVVQAEFLLASHHRDLFA